MRKTYEKGITLIALVVTIIVLLIIAGVSILMLTGNNGIINQAVKAKFLTEVSTLKEQLEIQEIGEGKEIQFGTIEGALDISSEYNEKLLIENGKLVYNPDKVSEKEKEWLEGIGIKGKSNYYLIMMEETKAKFMGQENIGTLEEFRDLVNAGNFNYDTAYIIENITINGSEENNWIPIGKTEDKPFEKIIEGNNNTIEGICIRTENECQGIFGYNTGTIKNINLRNLNMEMGAHSGGLAAYNNGGLIENCIVSESEIKGTGKEMGGIVGINYGGIVRKCINNSCTINNIGDYATGGIVGWNNEGSTTENCKNYADVKGIRDTGGVVGTNEKSSIVDNCSNSGTISVKGKIDSENYKQSNVGGIAGLSRTTCIVKNSTNDGKISIDNETEDIELNRFIGGIVGYNTDKCRIEKSINNAEIEGGQWVGGIAGQTEKNSFIEGCINTGKVTATGRLEPSDNRRHARLGGIAGNLSNTSQIEFSINNGKIYGNGIGTGGICGNLSGESIIENCYNTANINNEGMQTGGISGAIASGATLKCCYNAGEIVGKNYVGGLTGHLGWDGTGYIENCYNAGSVKATDNIYVGGLCFSYDGEIKNSYNIGKVICNTTTKYQGGIAAKRDREDEKCVIYNSYYLEGTSDGALNQEDIEGEAEIRTENQMKLEDFVTLLNTGNEKAIWKKSENNKNKGYPILNWQ